MKFAQILDDKVHWVGEYDTAPNFHPKAGQFIDITDMAPQPQEGWTYENGSFVEPVTPPQTVTMNVLSHDKWAIPADSTSVITLTYTSDEAVVFVVNEGVHIVTPENDVATLEISANAPGPITVEVRGQTLLLAATEVV